MSSEDQIPNPSEPTPNAEVESLLASVAEQKEGIAPSAPKPPPADDSLQPYDFRNPMLLAPRELRKLRLHQQEFIDALAARLSLYLRLEFSVKLTALQTIAYQKMAESWANPSHLTLFKTEPLRGVSVLEIPPRLGSCIVDRLMGGPGLPSESPREMSEIELALLEQVVQLIIAEWCSHWAKLKELKPVLLGHESNGRFVQTAPPETIMLVLGLEAGIGECVERMQIGFPYTPLEASIRKFSQTVAETHAEAIVSPGKTALKWNPCFDDVYIPVSAEWNGLEMTAREVLALKPGDLLRVDPQCVHRVSVRLADLPKFVGRPGTVSGKWAVELTREMQD